MGLLDDAIREHLELKRRRGADPAEVEHQEREALGPVGTGAAAGAPPTHAVATPDAPAAPDRAPEDLPARPAADREPPPADPEPLDGPEHHGAVRAPDPPPPAPQRDPEPPPPAPEPREPVSQPTQQYSVEELDELRRETEADDIEPADEDPGAEDVLDETPEFLQEAPEHDRLWFEQRPPRDFDF